MELARAVYGKYKNLIENVLFPVLLFAYPLLKVNQGLDVADTTYSLANFQYFGQMEGTWMVATFLANTVGSLFMRLPFGGTMIGMNFYTSLVQSATALMVYLGLRRRIPAPFLFLGEITALGLCWCPSTILYNYLTYFLMTAGILLLFWGMTAPSDFLRKPQINDKMAAGNPAADLCGAADTLCAGNGAQEGRDGKACLGKQRLCFAGAGVCLGANVAVRMPNVVQAAFILAVWYGIIIINKDDRQGMAGKAVDRQCMVCGRSAAVPWRALMHATAWCLAGYVLGFGIPLAVICIRYGVSAYPDMVTTMFAMTEQAVDYKPTSMLTGMFGDYIQGLYWMVFAGICIVAAELALLARKRLYGAEETAGHRSFEGGGKRVSAGYREDELSGAWNRYKITGVIIKTGYVALLLILLRFYWGRGMFTFHYYEYDYRSIYYPTVLFLLVTVYVCIYCLFAKRIGREQKIFAALVLLQIFVTPLGSNNKLQPIINNLFLTVPFTLWVVYGLLAGKKAEDLNTGVMKKESLAGLGNGTGICGDEKIAWTIPFTMLVIFLLVQSVGFHRDFVFQDGIWGEPRDMKVEVPEKAAGIYTNMENRAFLKELALFMQEEGLSGREAVTYGELPGLHYLLDMPPALSTAWPDLESYCMTEYKRDLAALENRIAAGEEPPVIILSTPVAAYLSDDGEAIVWFGVDMEAMAADEKLQMLAGLMREYGYAEVFGNARYVVYRAEAL